MGSFLFCPKSRTHKLDQQEEALLQCKITRDNIKQYINRLRKNEKVRKEKAKAALKEKNRERARMYLSQSKLYSEQIKVGQNQFNLIEEQIINIEQAQQMKEVFVVLQQGNNILKKLNEEVNIEKWEQIADDMSEIKQQQDEINQFLGSHNMDKTEYDEDVNRELDKLIASEAPSELELPEAGKKEPNIGLKAQVEDEQQKILEEA